jgi:hypothetical protein
MVAILAEGLMLYSIFELAEIGTSIGTLALAIATFATLREIRLATKREKHIKELELLVSPLNSKILKDTETKKLSASRKLFLKGVAAHPGYENYTDFWDPIKLNKHLGIDYLRAALNNYFNNKNNSSGDGARDDDYVRAEEELFEKTVQRYSELIEEINQIDAMKWWQFWK